MSDVVLKPELYERGKSRFGGSRLTVIVAGFAGFVALAWLLFGSESQRLGPLVLLGRSLLLLGFGSAVALALLNATPTRDLTSLDVLMPRVPAAGLAEPLPPRVAEPLQQPEVAPTTSGIVRVQFRHPKSVADAGDLRVPAEPVAPSNRSANLILKGVFDAAQDQGEVLFDALARKRGVILKGVNFSVVKFKFLNDLSGVQLKMLNDSGLIVDDASLSGVRHRILDLLEAPQGQLVLPDKHGHVYAPDFIFPDKMYAADRRMAGPADPVTSLLSAYRALPEPLRADFVARLMRDLAAEAERDTPRVDPASSDHLASEGPVSPHSAGPDRMLVELWLTTSRRR